MTKEEKIKEAWGEYYNEIEFYLTESGFMPYVYDVRMIRNENKIEFEHLPNNANLFRPKSLKGIENNNGWVKIESENDLPKENEQHYWTITENNPDIKERYFNKFFNEYKGEGKVTHYQPIEKQKPPIY